MTERPPRRNNSVMNKQAELGLNLSTTCTRKAVFLDEMELVVFGASLLI